MKQNLVFSISGQRKIETSLPAFIAGIINITADSFCPVGRCPPSATNDDTAAIQYAAGNAAETALKLVAAGADILDVGAESTRPGSVPVSLEEEMRRLIPAVRAIRKVTDCPISIDTTKAAVMKAALAEGADILNDVSALQNDGKMINVCSDAEIPVILMHNHDIMDVDSDDTVQIVSEHLAERVTSAVKAGIIPERIILDAGIGFGKTYEQNLCLIGHSYDIQQRVKDLTGMKDDTLFPVMMALSRKSCIGKITGREVEQRLAGTLAANMTAVQRGAVFLRVHDVQETRDMLVTMKALNKGENV